MSVCMREGLFEMGRQDFICQASDVSLSQSLASHILRYAIIYEI